MTFTKEKLAYIDKRFCFKKGKKPISKHVSGLGIELTNNLGDISVKKCDLVICELEELGRMIEELTMLKQAIEEETGLIL